MTGDQLVAFWGSLIIANVQFASDHWIAGCVWIVWCVVIVVVAAYRHD